MSSDDPRDASIERLLRRGAARAAAPQAADECLDGESLAAWMSHALSTADAARVERHVADCDRCQQVLAAFVRTEPPAPVALPWWRALRAGWLVPLATAVLVLAVWVALPRGPADEQPSAVARSEDQLLPAPAPLTPPAAQATGPMPDAARPAAESLEQTQKRLADSAPQRAPGAAAGNVTGLRAREEAAAARTESDARALARVAPTTTPTAGGVAESAAPSPPPPPAVGATAAREQRVVGIPEIVSPERAAMRAPAAAAADFVTAVRTTRWRIVDGTRIQRSSDNGGTWQMTEFSAAAPLTAGHSPMPNVMWLVGQRGTVYVTTDGTSFVRVPFAEPLDLVGVVAVDGQRAVITAADGRSWRTTDRGQAWLPQ